MQLLKLTIRIELEFFLIRKINHVHAIYNVATHAVFWIVINAHDANNRVIHCAGRIKRKNILIVLIPIKLWDILPLIATNRTPFNNLVYATITAWSIIIFTQRLHFI